jgi:histidyl-tRNA synthetase
MKPYPFSPPLSDSRIYVLDDPEKALEELTELCKEAIVLVIYNDPGIVESKLKSANRASRPIGVALGTNEPAKKVLLIEDAKVLAQVEEKLKALLPPEVSYEETAAVSIVMGKEQIAHTIPKGEWGSSDMRKAFNLAIIALPDNSTPSQA